MSKRDGDLNNLNSNAKKPKIDETLDDLWGDDLDINDVDDCLMLATQFCEQKGVVCTQRNNVSILPSYSAFQQTTSAFTSTQHSTRTLGSSKPVYDTGGAQLSSGLKRAQSFGYTSKDNDLELKIKQLEEQCEAKTGEISILRSKLQEMKSDREVEQNKTNKEWSEKLLVKTKQLKGAESELEFKNLEIMNLTQKLNATKQHHSNATRSQFFKQPNLDRSINVEVPERKKELEIEEFQIHVLPQQTYPLKDVITNDMFASSLQEMCLTDMNRKTYTCIQSSGEDELNNIVLKLSRLKAHEFDSIQNQMHIRHLLSLSEQLLQNLYRFLAELKVGTPTEDSRCINLEEMYLESLTLPKNQMGINAKGTINCISAALPYSSYLKRHFLQNSNCAYLTLLLSLLKFINELKLSTNFNYFLESVIDLLRKISRISVFEKLPQRQLFNDLTKKLILCSTNKFIFKHFLEFLNNATLQQNFLSNLHVDVNERKLVLDGTILSYTRSTCVVEILFVLLQEYLESNCLDNNLSALKFMSNSFMCNSNWLLYNEDKCPCLSKIVKLYIAVMYKTLQLKSKLKHKDQVEIFEQILKSGMDTLHTLNFNLYYFAKYVSTYSQYKVLVKSLLNMAKDLNLTDSQVEVLENLNKNEEVLSIAENAFENVALWKNSNFN